MFVSVFLACLVTTGQAAEQSRTAKSQPPGTFQVKVSKDNLSLDANQAPLLQIFQEIGKQAKITFDSNIGPEEKITIQSGSGSSRRGNQTTCQERHCFLCGKSQG